MKKRFSPNLATTGRWLRALGAMMLWLGGYFALRFSVTLASVLGLAGGFALFEALRGWCVLRACGIRTRF